MLRTRSRREFLKTSLAATVGGWTAAHGASTAERAGRLGMFVYLDGKEPGDALKPVKDLGFAYCEVYLNQFSDEYAGKLRHALADLGITATALFVSGPGDQVYDFEHGPDTIGLVPRRWRAERVLALKQGSDFAKQCGIRALETHVGFIPENPGDLLYRETVAAVREVAGHCGKHGQTFLYHAGQETPITLLRMLQDVGLENQGVGLDTANLIMCGKGHPLAALEVYGRWIKAVNAKDGRYPTDPKKLGLEAMLGEGQVGFPTFLKRLKAIGYDKPIIIEREVTGPELLEDFRRARTYLDGLLRQIG